MKKHLSIVLCGLLCLSGCSVVAEAMPSWFDDDKEAAVQNSQPEEQSRAADEEDGKLGVNPYLWQASLDKLSFMPLSAADSKGGVIITEWKQMGVDEEFKVNVTIYTRELRADSFKVEVFKRVMKKGMWVDAEPDKVLSEELEKAILLKARDLYHRDVVTR